MIISSLLTIISIILLSIWLVYGLTRLVEKENEYDKKYGDTWKYGK